MLRVLSYVKLSAARFDTRKDYVESYQTNAEMKNYEIEFWLCIVVVFYRTEAGTVAQIRTLKNKFICKKKGSMF